MTSQLKSNVDFLGNLKKETVRALYYQERIIEVKKEIVGNCPKCDGVGLITDKKVKMKLGRPTDNIRKYLQSIKEERKDCKCIKRFARAMSLIEANVPEDMWTVNRKSKIIEDHKIKDLTLKRTVSIKKTIEKFTRNLETMLKNGYGFTFSGPNGTGKTFFGCKIIVRALRKGYTAHYIMFFDLIEMLKEFDDDFVYSVIDEILSVDFLFIDELGKEYKTSQFVLTNLERLLKKRRSRKKPTIFATNLKQEEIHNVYGPSVESLVESRNLLLSFSGIPDKRKRDDIPGLKRFFGES